MFLAQQLTTKLLSIMSGLGVVNTILLVKAMELRRLIIEPDKCTITEGRMEQKSSLLNLHKISFGVTIRIKLLEKSELKPMFLEDPRMHDNSYALSARAPWE